MPNHDTPYYRPDLAPVHHLGFGFHADECAPGILELLRPITDGEGLVGELGCGSGLLTRYLVEAGHRVIVTDASPAMLDLARGYVVGAQEIRALVLPDDPIPEADAVVSVGHVLSYLPDAVGRWKEASVEVAIGVDPSKSSLAVAAVDPLGRVLDAREFSNDPRGHRALLRWARERGPDRVIGVECSLSYGASLSRLLLGFGEDVREVPTTLTHRQRRRRASQGKSDLVDSVAIARIVASGEVLPSAHRLEVLADLRALVEHRDQLVRARTQVANRTHADLVIVLPGYERQVPNLRAKAHRATARSLLKRDRSVRAELVRKRLDELSRLEGEIAAMDRRIEATVRKTGTSLTSISGVGPFIAAKILGEVGDPSRIRSKPAFAVLSGTAPLSASSGQIRRHRLNRGGNRQLNWALHYIALAQCRISPDAQAYMARQREAGKSHKEAMRCLKRHLSNVVYRHLVADARRVERAA